MKDGDTPVCVGVVVVGAQGLLNPSRHPQGCRQPFAGSVLQAHQPRQLAATS